MDSHQNRMDLIMAFNSKIMQTSDNINIQRVNVTPWCGGVYGRRIGTHICIWDAPFLLHASQIQLSEQVNPSDLIWIDLSLRVVLSGQMVVQGRTIEVFATKCGDRPYKYHTIPYNTPPDR